MSLKNLHLTDPPEALVNPVRILIEVVFPAPLWPSRLLNTLFTHFPTEKSVPEDLSLIHRDADSFEHRYFIVILLQVTHLHSFEQLLAIWKSFMIGRRTRIWWVLISLRWFYICLDDRAILHGLIGLWSLFFLAGQYSKPILRSSLFVDAVECVANEKYQEKGSNVNE